MGTEMLERYNTTLGLYEPAIFHLHTVGKGRLNNIESWSLLQKSTFLHEYIHFLQDITTIQGLNNMFITSDYIYYVTQQIKEQGRAEVHVPISPQTIDHNVGQNWFAHACTMGTESSVEKAISFTKAQIATLTDNDSGKTIPVNGIIVRCVDKSTQYKNVLFGTIQMMEGMAYLIEEEVYPNTDYPPPYNPYIIARDIAEMIIPGLSTKPKVMIALFMFALQRSNPGCDFVDYLKAKAINGFTAETLTPEIIYGDLQRTSMALPNGVLNYEESHRAFAEAVQEVMSKYLGDVGKWHNINNWFQTIIQKGSLLKLQSPFLFQELAEGGDITNNIIFQMMLRDFGTPIVTNDTHDFNFIRPDSVLISMRELINVYAMTQIYQVFLSNGTYRCPLTEYCQREHCGIRGQIVDKLCLANPWKHATVNNHCYFKTWWKSMGLENIDIVG